MDYFQGVVLEYLRAEPRGMALHRAGQAQQEIACPPGIRTGIIGFRLGPRVSLTRSA